MKCIVGTNSPDASWLVIASENSSIRRNAIEFYEVAMRQVLLDVWDDDAETTAQIDELISSSSPIEVERNIAESRMRSILQMFEGFELDGETVDCPNVEIEMGDKLLCFQNEWDMFVLVISNEGSNRLFAWETTA